jgi:hypothetical protein
MLQKKTIEPGTLELLKKLMAEIETLAEGNCLESGIFLFSCNFLSPQKVTKKGLTG